MIDIRTIDAMARYDSLPSPVVIMSDGPYGVNGYKGA